MGRRRAILDREVYVNGTIVLDERRSFRNRPCEESAEEVAIRLEGKIKSVEYILDGTMEIINLTK